MIKNISQEQLTRIRRRLRFLYGDQADCLAERFYHLIGRYGVGVDRQGTAKRRWDQKDVMLITYADMVSKEGERPLQTLTRFCADHLKGAVSTVHILPFYPWSSDDGFSVIDYRQVEPAYGTWDDVEALGGEFHLAFDLVLNHCSAESEWFRDFLTGISPARHYFLEMDANTDLSSVFRPRTSPLLTKTQTREGGAHVWTTFSADQVDLNWQNPDLLFEFLDILFLYISKGVRILRLDAVAFCWKELGTSCVHLPQTHELVKLIRDVCEIVAPQAIILTETNVPHPENVSYFGKNDEAHMVYNFSLPPLTLHALLTGSGKYLTDWAGKLEYPGKACTFLNFTASHDGVGVGPARGILPDTEIDMMVEHVKKAGGKVSNKTLPDGTEIPYEMNITYSSALGFGNNPTLGSERFLCSQGIALALKGVPAVYFHSLMATPNYLEGVAETGRARTINRRKYEEGELYRVLTNPSNTQGSTFRRYVQLLRRRANNPAFNPDGHQFIHDIGSQFFVVERRSTLHNQHVYCIFNLTSEEQIIKNPADNEVLKKAKKFYDIVSGKTFSSGKKGIKMAPYHFFWLVPRDE